MRNKYLKNKNYAIKLALVIIWMGFIYFMSNQPAEISDSQSSGVIQMLSELGIDMNGIFGDIANFIVRKIAHFLEYMILGILIINLIKQDFKLYQIVLISIFVVFLYACTDEFHQLFVIGRDGNFRDVLIDTSGGAMSAILFSIKRWHNSNKISN